MTAVIARRAAKAGPAAPAAPSAADNRGEAQEVRLVSLRRTFGDVAALDGLDLTIPAGQLVTLLGPSGCGKTTALRVLAGLEDVDAGTVLVGGKDISAVPARRRDLSMVFQAYSLMPHMTVAQNIEFALELRGIARRSRSAVVDEHLGLVGLGTHRHRYPHQLSGGQQQRVALARALAVRPQVLLLDEPLSALDATVRVQLRDEIRRIQRHVGITTVLVTHDQTEALAISDLVAVMSAGRVVQVAAPEDVYCRPADAFVAEFVGETTRLAGTAADGRVRVGAAGGVPLLGDLPLLPGSASSEVDVLVRPEHVHVEPAADTGAAPGAEAVRVAAVTFLGAHAAVVLDVPGGQWLRATLPAASASALEVGTVVNVRLAEVPALAVPRR